MSEQIDIVTLFVPGRPRTKGSLKPIVNWAAQSVHMEEEVRLSKPWRVAVANAVVRHIAVQHIDKRWQLRHGFPWVSPVSIDLSFRFERERGDRAVWPIDVRYGDSDKLTRNVLDALTDAKLYQDDAQVIDVRATKRFTAYNGLAGAESPGVMITARRMLQE